MLIIILQLYKTVTVVFLRSSCLFACPSEGLLCITECASTLFQVVGWVVCVIYLVHHLNSSFFTFRFQCRLIAQKFSGAERHRVWAVLITYMSKQGRSYYVSFLKLVRVFLLFYKMAFLSKLNPIRRSTHELHQRN